MYAQVQLANNTSSHATNDNVSELSTETRELREALLKTQQQLEMFTRQPIGATPTAAPTWPHVPAQPPPTYVPPTHLPVLHLGFYLLVRVFQGGGVPLLVHILQEVPVGKWLLEP